MKRYTNISKQTLTFSLNGENGGDFIIAAEASVELPANNAYVQSLAAQGYIKETETDNKSTKKDK